MAARQVHLTFEERPRDLYNLRLTVDRSKEIRSGTAEKYIPSAQDWHAVATLLSRERRRQRKNTERKPVTFCSRRKTPSQRAKKKPVISHGLKSGAGEEGRTPDLMLGKHGRKKKAH
jgi:hypothetical protein